MGKRGKTGEREFNKLMGIRPRPTRPKCPRYLHPIAKKEWRRVVPELDRLGLLATIDGAAIEGYCNSYAAMVTAQQFINERGSFYETDTGYVRPVPQVKILFESMVALRTFAVELGLTPAARARLQIPAPDSDDEMDEFLREIGH